MVVLKIADATATADGLRVSCSGRGRRRLPRARQATGAEDRQPGLHVDLRPSAALAVRDRRHADVEAAGELFLREARFLASRSDPARGDHRAGQASFAGWSRHRGRSVGVLGAAHHAFQTWGVTDARYMVARHGCQPWLRRPNLDRLERFGSGHIRSSAQEKRKTIKRLAQKSPLDRPWTGAGRWETERRVGAQAHGSTEIGRFRTGGQSTRS